MVEKCCQKRSCVPRSSERGFGVVASVLPHFHPCVMEVAGSKRTVESSKELLPEIGSFAAVLLIVLTVIIILKIKTSDP